MMQALRKNTKVIIWIIVAAFVGTIIFAWGADITSSRTPGGAPIGVVGSVNGREIPLNNFGLLADQYIDRERQQNPEKDFTESDYREARRNAWNEYVASYIQQDEIERLKIELTDEELVDFIRRYPPAEVQNIEAFLTNGQFDYNKYLQAMGDPQFRDFWAQVEMLMRPRLTGFKLQEYVGSQVRVSDVDLQSRYLRENERIKVNYALVPYNKYTLLPSDVDSAEVIAYYNAHPDEFQQPEQAYYTTFRITKEPGEADLARALERIKEIKAEVDAGLDFADAAERYTEDPSGRGRGGSLDWFGRGAMVAPFDSAVFEMPDGAISEPVKTQFGYHLIHRTGYRKAHEREEVEASHILIKPEISQQTLDDITQRLKSAAEKASDPDIEEIARGLGVIVDPQRKLTRGGAISGIGQDSDLEKFLFTAKPGTMSFLLDRGQSLYMIRADKVVPAGLAPLEEVFPVIQRNLTDKIQRRLALADVQKIYDEIVSGKTLEEAAKVVDVTISDSPFFARTGRLPRIGNDPAFIGTAFSLSEAKRYSQPVLTQAGAIVIEFEERLAATLDGFAAQKDTLKAQILQTRQSDLWNRWFSRAANRATIEDYRREIFGEAL